MLRIDICVTWIRLLYDLEGLLACRSYLMGMYVDPNFGDCL